ncbi:hypothetical protein I309_01162 [Cryptococcus deuterogattii LA55]|nr:hypothetical protein I309_01162 [Cryptococcus deuterogattii LA55]KIR95763.1 hypothetical protein I304_00519 [Cryptococcus deuterogattii CBS 10090]
MVLGTVAAKGITAQAHCATTILLCFVCMKPVCTNRTAEHNSELGKGLFSVAFMQPSQVSARPPRRRLPFESASTRLATQAHLLRSPTPCPDIYSSDLLPPKPIHTRSVSPSSDSISTITPSTYVSKSLHSEETVHIMIGLDASRTLASSTETGCTSMGMDQKRRNSTQRRLAVLRDLICDLDFNQSWSTSHTSLQVDELPSTRAPECNSVDDFSVLSRPLSKPEMRASFISNPLYLRFRPSRMDLPKGIVEPDLDLSNIQCPVPDHLAVPHDAEAIPRLSVPTSPRIPNTGVTQRVHTSRSSRTSALSISSSEPSFYSPSRSNSISTCQPLIPSQIPSCPPSAASMFSIPRLRSSASMRSGNIGKKEDVLVMLVFDHIVILSQMEKSSPVYGKRSDKKLKVIEGGVGRMLQIKNLTGWSAMLGIQHNISSPFLHSKPVPLHFDLNAPTIITFNGFLKILCQGMEIGAVNSPAGGEDEVLKV